MDENAYGMNRASVKAQIYGLNHAAVECYSKFNGEFYDVFLPTMRKAWKSPVAYNVSAEHFNAFMRALDNFTATVTNICVDATEAFNSLAAKHGVEPIPVNWEREVEYDESITYDVYLDKDDGNGGVFLNDTLCLTAIDILSAAKDTFVSAARSLPTDISIYDPDLSIRTSFNQRINSRVDQVVTMVNKIIYEINQAMHFEINSVKYASAGAAEKIKASKDNNNNSNFA